MFRPIRFNSNNGKENTSSTAGEPRLLSSNFRGLQIFSDTFRYSPKFSSRSGEQIQAVKCWLARVNNDSKGPDREMSACESTTPRCNPHLKDKPTVRTPACEIRAPNVNE